ncbi:protein-export chaperone SecB [Lentilactobacillus parakefiri]|uniref:Preprotein translocase subunit SecB n=1 Tax=Lentilactobacillus parakefiri TaxID=152332 RepID=A0A224VFC9_9LACO|nr:protein-export chaperone SecB [Lentilactobacillus parakefiri]KRL58935.1 hypothetical protein FD08_GL003307 [Lentilactobacillus parakefiri DSM 10551]PAL00274.1 hypothetical protein B8W96_07240 [Lentilactobacillus parakefiri]TDG90671.1 hypothetical protein C5L28_000386 [Lentilactobacillus parakefiri]GAW70950.1 preprotein translocase subunit SecB [Lentilactobacillus parakefiri]
MAVIDFKNYRIIKMYYERNKSFKNIDNGKNTISPQFSVHINDSSKDKVIIKLSVKIDENNFPFKLEVSLEGMFAYNSDEDATNIGKEVFFSRNAVAILFPYLRSCVSSLTNLSNENRALILPTMNIVELLKKQGNLK